MRAESVWVETFTGLRTDRFAKLVKVGAGAGRERAGGWPPVVSAAGGPGAAGGRVLPHQPHDAAARPALRDLPGHRLQGDPAARAAACAGAGPAAGRRRRTVVDRGRHLDPGPRPEGRRLLPQLPVLGERAGRRRCRQPPGGRLGPAGTGEQGRCPRLARVGPARRGGRDDSDRRRRLLGHRPDRPAPQKGRTPPPARSGGGQRRTRRRLGRSPGAASLA